MISFEATPMTSTRVMARFIRQSTLTFWNSYNFRKLATGSRRFDPSWLSLSEPAIAAKVLE